MLFYLGLQKIAWAEGVDDKMLENCLRPTFDNWFSLFIDVLETETAEYLELKIQVLKVKNFIKEKVFNNYI